MRKGCEMAVKWLQRLFSQPFLRRNPAGVEAASELPHLPARYFHGYKLLIF